jgi:hypothetical protein
MSSDDVVKVGKLVLVAVALGALIATAAPPTGQALAKVLAGWFGG